MDTTLLQTSFFDKKQRWHLTYGLYIPIFCVFMSYILGKMEIKYIQNPGIKSVFFGGIIAIFCYILLRILTNFSFMNVLTMNEIINNSILCGILSAESMIFIGEHKHLELQKILLFLFLYFHNLNL